MPVNKVKSLSFHCRNRDLSYAGPNEHIFDQHRTVHETCKQQSGKTVRGWMRAFSKRVFWQLRWRIPYPWRARNLMYSESRNFKHGPNALFVDIRRSVPQARTKTGSMKYWNCPQKPASVRP